VLSDREQAIRDLYLHRIQDVSAAPLNLPLLVGFPAILPQGVRMNSDKLVAHWLINRYGEFQLTDAIRPALDVPIEPREGYRLAVYRDEEQGIEIPSLVAAVSAERLFDLFLALLAPLGDTVDAILETSHATDGAQHLDLCREQIDLPVLMSHFCDYEELLLNDGCTGVAVLSSYETQEVQFDEHKLLIVYADDLEPFERILLQAGLSRNDDLRLITEADHLHSTDARHIEAFERLGCVLGVGEPLSV
jgi:hypothetical protein